MYGPNSSLNLALPMSWLDTLLQPSIEGAGRGGSLTGPLNLLVEPPVSSFDPILQGFVASLLANTALRVIVSLLAPARQRDIEQARIFVDGDALPPPVAEGETGHDPRVHECRALAPRFIGAERAERAFAGRQIGRAHV